jgi:hypothetical protein
MKISQWQRCAILGLCGLSCVTAVAADWSWSVGAGYGHTDNRFKQEANPQSDSSFDTTLVMDGQQRGARFDAKLAANVAYNYRVKDASKDVEGGVAAAFEYRPLPDYLHLMLTDNFGQILGTQNSPDLVVDTPENRVNFNIVEAGPDIFLPLGKRLKLDFSGRYAHSTFGESLTDSTRITKSASMNYALTTSSSAALSASNSHTAFDKLDNDVFSYDVVETALNYRLNSARTTADVSAGRTQLKYRFRELPATTLVRALVSHEFGTRLNVVLGAGTNYSGASNNFVLDQGLLGVDSGTLTDPYTTDAYKSDYADLSGQFSGARVRFTLGAGWARARHVDLVQLNDSTKGVRLSLTRSISQRLDWRISGNYGVRQFELTSARYTDWNAGTGLTWNYTSTVNMRLDYAHVYGVRTGLLTQATPYNFKENQVSLRFFYSPRR